MKKEFKPRNTRNTRKKALKKTPHGFADVRLNKGEVILLNCALKKHANELRDHATAMMRMANCLENCGNHVQRLLDPEPA